MSLKVTVITLEMSHIFNADPGLYFETLSQHNNHFNNHSHLFWVHHFSFFFSVPMHLIVIRVLWLVFAAFSSIAISTVNHADSRASLASIDSNPSTNEKSSEKTDNCEKVQFTPKWMAYQDCKPENSHLNCLCWFFNS